MSVPRPRTISCLLNTSQLLESVFLLFANQPCLRVGPSLPPPPSHLCSLFSQSIFSFKCRPNISRLQTQYISLLFVVQTSYIKRFCTIAEKMRLDTRIRMHRSRASSGSTSSRYDRFCAHRAIEGSGQAPPLPPLSACSDFRIKNDH